MFDFRWDAAEEEYRRAIVLNPNVALAHLYYSFLLTFQGRFPEALREEKEAQNLDPASLRIKEWHAAILYYEHDFDHAIEEERKILDIDPNYLLARSAIADFYVGKGQWNEAAAELAKAATLSGNPEEATEIQVAYREHGYKGLLRYFIKRSGSRASAKDYDPERVARYYALLGEKDEAFHWLEKAYSDEPSLSPVKVEPEYDSLRSDPRFADLVRRIGLAQ